MMKLHPLGGGEETPPTVDEEFHPLRMRKLYPLGEGGNPSHWGMLKLHPLRIKKLHPLGDEETPPTVDEAPPTGGNRGRSSHWGG